MFIKIITSGDAEASKLFLYADMELADLDDCNATYYPGAPDPMLRFGVHKRWQLCASTADKEICPVRYIITSLFILKHFIKIVLLKIYSSTGAEQ